MSSQILKNVYLFPKTTNQKLLAEYYSLADVFVICSKKENYPTTSIEAQCCGTPVVGFDTGGTKETALVMKDGFVSYGDIDGLKEKVLKALDQDTSELSTKAKTLHSKGHMAEEYLAEYDQTGKKERVLLIDVNCKNSSTGKIVYDLYNSLRENGRNAAVCYGRGPKINEENIYKFGLDIETYFHAALSRITGLNGCFSLLSTYRLLKYIDSFQPDLVHIHELHAYFVNIKTLIKYLKKKNIQVVWTFHCEYMYTGKCGHAYECIHFMNECGNCPAIRDYPKSILFDRTNKMFKAKKELLENWDFSIVTPSEWLANRVRLSFLKGKKIQVIHNGIDTKVFHKVDTEELRENLGISKEKKVILALAPGIMSEQKGGEWIVELAKRMNDEKYMFLLVGDNKD